MTVYELDRRLQELIHKGKGSYDVCISMERMFTDIVELTDIDDKDKRIMLEEK